MCRTPSPLVGQWLWEGICITMQMSKYSRKEGRKEGRKDRRTEGRKEVSKQAWFSLADSAFQASPLGPWLLPKEGISPCHSVDELCIQVLASRRVLPPLQPLEDRNQHLSYRDGTGCIICMLYYVVCVTYFWGRHEWTNPLANHGWVDHQEEGITFWRYQL